MGVEDGAVESEGREVRLGCRLILWRGVKRGQMVGFEIRDRVTDAR